MRRFASHYLYLPSYGFLKQYVVGIDDEDKVVALYPLTEEAECIIWTPGVIILIPQKVYPEISNKKDTCRIIKEIQGGELLTFKTSGVLESLPEKYQENMIEQQYMAIRLYPFDYTRMQPVSETVIQLLDNHTF